MPVLPSYRNQSICCANQMTGFYIRATLAFNGLIESLLSPMSPNIDNCFTVVIQINGSFTAAAKDNEFVIKIFFNRDFISIETILQSDDKR